MQAFLAAHEDNVVAVHCKAGKVNPPRFVNNVAPPPPPPTLCSQWRDALHAPPPHAHPTPGRSREGFRRILHSALLLVFCGACKL
jgi:hypothetical protein